MKKLAFVFAVGAPRYSPVPPSTLPTGSSRTPEPMQCNNQLTSARVADTTITAIAMLPKLRLPQLPALLRQ